MMTYSRAAIAFSVLVIVWFVSGCKDRSVPHEEAFSKSSELTRVTSPNGQLDAVLVTYSYGPEVESTSTCTLCRRDFQYI